MGFFSRIKSGVAGSPLTAPVAEHAVIARYQLGAGPSGTATDMHSLASLEDRLIQAIGAARAGEFEGPQFGAGEVTLYAYGPDADRLYAAMEPVLRSFPPRPAQVLLRYGAYEDTHAPERLLEL
jgi:hypothetical protein